jgi:glycopeptide antibiotics resistance protein
MTVLEFELIYPGYPGFIPGSLLAVVISFAMNGLISKVLYVRRCLAFCLIITLGLILSATMTVGGESQPSVNKDIECCDFTRLALAPVAELFAVNETSLNVFLFVPFGLVIGLIHHSPRKVPILVAAFALPFGIETVQLLMPAMNRTCQSADVIDNLIGLVVGLILGKLTKFLTRNDPMANHRIHP